MRAEAQAHADQIKQDLALLRRFLDWDRALKRLYELNAKVEDQALWNDPKAAQEVMRERRRLEDAINATSSPHAPWHVVPADKKWVRDLYVSSVLVSTLAGLKMAYPDPPAGLEKVRID